MAKKKLARKAKMSICSTSEPYEEDALPAPYEEVVSAEICEEAPNEPEPLSEVDGEQELSKEIQPSATSGTLPQRLWIS